VHPNNILIYTQQSATLHSLFYLETALRVLGGTTTHHQARKQLYLQHLVCVTTLLLPAAIAAGSSYVVKHRWCCRYSCLRSWWWEGVSPETYRAVSRSNKRCNVASCRTYVRILQESLFLLFPWWFLSKFSLFPTRRQTTPTALFAYIYTNICIYI
jgi:hypothetical protein